MRRKSEARKGKSVVGVAAAGVLLAGLLAGWPMLMPGKADDLPAPVAAGPPPGGRLLLRDGAGERALAPEQTTVRIQVHGTLARVQVKQRFRNPEDRPLPATYRFPLPGGALVDRLRLQQGERLVEGRIEPRPPGDGSEELAGRPPRVGPPEVFSLDLQEIDRRGGLVIDFEYRQQLQARDGLMSLRVPLARGGPAAAGRGPPVDILAEIEAGFPLHDSVRSNHPVELRRTGRTSVRVRLAQPAPNTGSFDLHWRPDVGATPRVALFGESRYGERHVMALLMPPSEASEVPLRTPRETVFLLGTAADRSILAAVAAAVGQALRRLQPGDRFNVAAIGAGARPAFETAVAPGPRTLQEAESFLAGLRPESLRAGAGAALLQALCRGPDPGRLRQVILIGAESAADLPALLDGPADRNGACRLFTVAIGRAGKPDVLARAAEMRRGEFLAIDKPHDIEARLGRFLAAIERPLLTDLHLEWPQGLAVETFPAALPDVYADRPVRLLARLPDAGLPRGAALEIRGRSAGRNWKATLPLGKAVASDEVAAAWAEAKIAALIAGPAPGETAEEARETALQIALRHQMVTPLTRLDAIDLTPAGGSRPAAAPVQVAEASTAAAAGGQGIAEAVLHLAAGAGLMALALAILAWRPGWFRR